MINTLSSVKPEDKILAYNFEKRLRQNKTPSNSNSPFIQKKVVQKLVSFL